MPAHTSLQDLLSSSMSPQDHVALVTLNCRGSCTGDVPLAEYSATHETLLHTTVQSLTASGSTPLWQKMLDAIAIMTAAPSTSVRWIVALTDGAASDDGLKGQVHQEL